jgi:archaellum biogenesis ATPase FlaH
MPNIDFTNAKFENSPCFVIDSTNNTINYDSPDLINKILENQRQLIENQGKLIENFIKK